MTISSTSENFKERIIKKVKHYESVLKASKDWVVDGLDVVKDY